MANLKNTTINDTGFLQVPVGNTNERASSPAVGMLRWNTDLGGLENYNGTEWKPVVTIPITADGGTVTEITDGGNNYRIHTFTSSGTFTVSSTGTTNAEVEYLAVGGGGGGGNSTDSGGGGAGGLIFEKTTVTNQSYTVTVGNGGSVDTNGQNSSVFGATALGGGHGGINTSASGNSGGSGGGGGYDTPSGSGLQPGSASGGFGNDGESSSGGSASDGKGGGGAGQPGSRLDANFNGIGGDGLSSVTLDGTVYDFAQTFGTANGDVVGSEVYFAGGGSGGGENPQPDSVGGGLGGGAGCLQNSIPNTGGGGAATDDDDIRPSVRNGASGIVMIRYRI